MNEPTDKQIKEFWEWCGFKHIWVGTGQCHGNTGSWYWEFPLGDSSAELPAIDLNNLFKYAVPKVTANDDYTVQIATSKYHTMVRITPHYEGMPMFKYAGEGGQDPALALFWALREVLND